ncbi:MAG: peptidoglycan DD-metalloendopeptidase family protein [Oscillospiraceae bacterium]|nr:peptidoglycan DD-metalloendopeptidase family protein [Oscillospiraceae bacterium]
MKQAETEGDEIKMNVKKTRIKEQIIRRVFVVGLCSALLFGIIWVSPAAETTEEIKSKMEQIEDRIEKQQEEINALRNDKKDQEKLIAALDKQVDDVTAKTDIIDAEIAELDGEMQTLETKIEKLNDSIDDLQTKIADIETKTGAKEALIVNMQESLKQRLRQQYMAGPASNLQLLLSSPDLAGFLTMTEYIHTVAVRDAALKESLETEMKELLALKEDYAAQTKEINGKKADLEAEKAVFAQKRSERRAAKKELDNQHDRISAAMTEIYAIIATLDRESSEAKRLLEKDRKAQEELERKLDEKLREKKQSGAINPDNIAVAEGKMRWPVPYEACYISSLFGDTVNRSHTHKGLDISASGANNKDYSIIAALDGEVLETGYSSSMGNYVVLYHGIYAVNGKEIKTTYMHLRSVADIVKEGVRIKAGKIIGIMGSTGNSTGAHLHFQINEIHSDNSSTPVDPLKYVSNPYD